MFSVNEKTSRYLEPNRTTPSVEIVMKIERAISYEEGCHIWTRFFAERIQKCKVYIVKNGNPKRVDVQRFLWQLEHGEMSQSTVLKTSCFNNRCVNMEHVQIVEKVYDWDKAKERMLKNTRRKKGCLVWTGPTNGGYGQFNVNGKNYGSSLAAYVIKTRGAYMPKEISGVLAQVRHTCGNSKCVKFSHLDRNTIIMNNGVDKLNHGTLMRGEKHPLTKLSEEIVSEIKSSKRNSDEDRYETPAKRAKRFGVSISIIRDIDVGKSWSHVPDRYGKTISRDNENAKQRENKKRARERIWTIENFEAAGGKLSTQKEISYDDNRGDVDGPCWNFTGGFQGRYGLISFLGKTMRAHVLSCEVKEKRHRKQGEVCRHLCGNPRCVYPGHLVFGSQSENMVDAIKHGSKTAKLDDKKVREIRKSTLRVKDLASLFNVSEPSIRNVINKKTWSHVV